MQKKKTCFKCKRELLSEMFSKNSRRKDGLQTHCKDCQLEYKRSHYERNKDDYLKKSYARKKAYREEFLDFLKTQKCKDCGNDDYRVFEFDHLYDKKFDISRKIGGQTLSSLMEEIEKCDIVCANCHRIRTCIRGNWYRNK